MASLAPKSSSQGSALVARFLHPSHSSFPLHWESLRGSTIAGLGPFLPSAQGTGKQSCQHLHSSVQLTCLSPSPWKCRFRVESACNFFGGGGGVCPGVGFLCPAWTEGLGTSFHQGVAPLEHRCTATGVPGPLEASRWLWLRDAVNRLPGYHQVSCPQALRQQV